MSERVHELEFVAIANRRLDEVDGELLAALLESAKECGVHKEVASAEDMSELEVGEIIGERASVLEKLGVLLHLRGLSREVRRATMELVLESAPSSDP